MQLAFQAYELRITQQVNHYPLTDPSANAAFYGGGRSALSHRSSGMRQNRACGAQVRQALWRSFHWHNTCWFFFSSGLLLMACRIMVEKIVLGIWTMELLIIFPMSLAISLWALTTKAQKLWWLEMVTASLSPLLYFFTSFIWFCSYAFSSSQ